MKQVKISDITMAQPEKGFSLSFREKIELAKLLDSLGVDVIAIEGIEDSRTDALRIKSIAAAVKESAVAVAVQLNPENILQVWDAVKQAKHPRLQVVAAVSSVQMEYRYHKKADAMLAAVKESIALCRSMCADVEFIAEDATRGEPEFLHTVLSEAIQAGAQTVTVRDSAGNLLPQEFGGFVASLYDAVPGLKGVSLGVACANTLALADSCAIAAVDSGAVEIQAAAYSVDCCSLASIARILSARGDTLGVETGLKVAQLSRIVDQVTWMCQTDRKKTSPFDSGVRREETGIFLTAHDDIAAVTQAVRQLGYDLSEEDIPKVYAAFSAIAAKKDKVSVRELEAIVASAAMQVPPAYTLETYAIHSGNTAASSAHLRLKRDGKVLEGICLGDGPIDAAFLAIEQITGRHYELDDFQIQAVTEGREAMGQTIVRLRWGGKLYSGKGISTDIVCASIYAYLNALNKIVYEEEEV